MGHTFAAISLLKKKHLAECWWTKSNGWVRRIFPAEIERNRLGERIRATRQAQKGPRRTPRGKPRFG
jgi:hypothetical protein